MDSYLGLLFLATTVGLPVETSSSGPCEVGQGAGRGPVSCTPCNIGKLHHHEVHVRNVATADTTTAKVKISLRSGVFPRPLRLLLLSNVPLHWELEPTSNLVNIDKVVTMSSGGLNSTISYTREFKLLKPTHIHKDTSSMTHDPNQVAILLHEKGLGEMTSYVADFDGQAAFDIVLGECESVKPGIKPTDEELKCLPNSQCLIAAGFDYKKDRTECTGKSYITKYSSLYVGIVLCNPQRYKLYMSNLLEGPFMDIADPVPINNYFGTDHCEVFGRTDESMTETSHTYSPRSECKSGYGFYREHLKQIFLFGKICGDTHNVVTYTGRASPSWYQCDQVLIPGNFDIVNASWQDSIPTPRSITAGPGPQPQLMTIIIPAVLGVVLTLVVISLVIVFYRRRGQQQQPAASGLTPRRESRDLLQDGAMPMDMTTRPPAELPPEAVREDPEGEYSYAGFESPPRHCPKPPCDPDWKPVAKLHTSSVPNVYTTGFGNHTLQNDVPDTLVIPDKSTAPKLVTGPKIQAVPHVMLNRAEYENSPNTQAITSGLLAVPRNPHIPSAPNTPTPQKKPSSPLVPKKPFIPKSPVMTKQMIIPGSQNPDSGGGAETGIIATAVQAMAPIGFLAELGQRLPARAKTTVNNDGTPYDNHYDGGDEEGMYLEVLEKPNT